eukprot:gene7559-biopygen4559
MAHVPVEIRPTTQAWHSAGLPSKGVLTSTTFSGVRKNFLKIPMCWLCDRGGRRSKCDALWILPARRMPQHPHRRITPGACGRGQEESRSGVPALLTCPATTSGKCEWAAPFPGPLLFAGKLGAQKRLMMRRGPKRQVPGRPVHIPHAFQGFPALCACLSHNMPSKHSTCIPSIPHAFQAFHMHSTCIPSIPHAF